MIFIDTTYLLALFNPLDELRERAEIWSLHLNEPLVVTEHVLWEAIDAFSAPEDRSKAKALVTSIRRAENGVEIVWSTPQLFDAGIALHSARPDKYWSLTDCVAFVVMQQRGIRQALTYDRHFEQAGFEALLRRDP